MKNLDIADYITEVPATIRSSRYFKHRLDLERFTNAACEQHRILTHQSAVEEVFQSIESGDLIVWTNSHGVRLSGKVRYSGFAQPKTVELSDVLVVDNLARTSDVLNLI